MSTVNGTLPIISGSGKIPTGASGALTQPGDPIFYDADGNGIADPNDKIVIGNPNPKITYGFGLDFSWKGFFLNAAFNGVYGNQIFNANRIVEEQLYNITSNNISRKAYYGMWRPDNQTGGYPKLDYNPMLSVPNSMLVEDGSYLRCSLISLGYNWRLKKGLPISGIGVNATVRNLFLITNYSGYDPEVSSFGNQPLREGIDWGSDPGNRTYTLGITLDF
jgi:hypothetical protein